MNAAKMAMLALALCGICAAQQDAELNDWMATSNKAMAVLEKLDPPTGPEAVRAAERLGGVFESLIGFWRQKNTPDAVKLAEQGKAAAVVLASAAFANKPAEAAAAFKTLSDTFTRHDAYLERLPDGKYRGKLEQEKPAPPSKPKN